MLPQGIFRGGSHNLEMQASPLRVLVLFLTLESSILVFRLISSALSRELGVYRSLLNGVIGMIRIEFDGR